MIDPALIADHLISRGYRVSTVRDRDGRAEVVLDDPSTPEQRAAAQAEAETRTPTAEQRADERLERVDLPRRLLAALTLRAWPDATPGERAWAAEILDNAGRRIREARA